MSKLKILVLIIAMTVPRPGRVGEADLVGVGRGDGVVALHRDGQCQQHRGGDGHVAHRVAGRQHQPGVLTCKYFLKPPFFFSDYYLYISW